MNNLKKKRGLPVVWLTALILCLFSCGLPLMESDGNLTFPGFEDFRSIFGAVRGELNFGEVLVDEDKVLSLTLGNSGGRDLLLDSIAFLGEDFDFADHVTPEFPVLIPSQGEKTFYIGFFPGTNGSRQGKAVITAGEVTRYIDLKGDGVWEVILSINTAEGEILSPVSVTVPGEPGQQTVTTVDGLLTLSAEPAFLRKLSQWAVFGTPDTAPEFVDETAMVTDVTINAHTHIEAFFVNPWVFFPTDEAVLQAAVTAVAGDPDKEGVIIENGIHSITASVTVPAGVSLYGGYNTGSPPTARAYKTPADREDAAYRAVLEFASGAGITVNGASGINIEGLTLRSNAAGTTPPLRITSGSKAVAQYCTVTSQNSGPALRTVGASPTVQYCLIQGGNAADESVAVYISGGEPFLSENDIRGGNTTADYSDSYTLWCDDYTEAVVFKNTITGGSAAGKESESFGVFLDWFAEPLMVGNTIDGGSAPGSGGITNGIYFINNGKSTIRYNSISGGAGKGIARALYSAYGTNLYLRYNLITNAAAGTGSKYGIYLGANGRVRRLVANQFKNVGTAYQYTLCNDKKITTVDDLNTAYNATGDTTKNLDAADSFAPVPPAEPGKPEWEE